jgi:hypothetical protein
MAVGSPQGLSVATHGQKNRTLGEKQIIGHNGSVGFTRFRILNATPQRVGCVPLDLVQQLPASPDIVRDVSIDLLFHPAPKGIVAVARVGVRHRL